MCFVRYYKGKSVCITSAPEIYVLLLWKTYMVYDGVVVVVVAMIVVVKVCVRMCFCVHMCVCK